MEAGRAVESSKLESLKKQVWRKKNRRPSLGMHGGASEGRSGPGVGGRMGIPAKEAQVIG